MKNKILSKILYDYVVCWNVFSLSQRETSSSIQMIYHIIFVTGKVPFSFIDEDRVIFSKTKEFNLYELKLCLGEVRVIGRFDEKY